MSEAPALRIVPGAPPPAPLTKSQKKKRRAALASAKGDEHEIDSPVTAVNGHGLNSAVDAALVDSVPASNQLSSNLLTKPEDMANVAIASETASEVAGILPLSSKRGTSAVVELVNKRHRALHKKIQRVKEYAAKPPNTLNEDQKKSLATLPILEASAKEVEEVRKAIEVHEAEEAANETRRLAEIEAIVKQRIADAVAEARSTTVSRTVELVTIIRELPKLKEKAASSGSNPVGNLESAIHGDSDNVESTVGVFLAGQGDYTVLVEILKEHLAPPRPPTPEPEPEPAAEEEEEEDEPAPIIERPFIGGVPSSATMGGSFQFMHESELEPNTPFDEGAEWVEHADAAPVHGVPKTAPAEEPVARGQGNLDWAADEHQEDLPPIAGLQEHFGASGQATPIAETPAEAWGTTPADGGWSTGAEEAAPKSNVDDDGFTTIPNKRGTHGGDWRGGDRARGRGGFRGRGGSGNWERREGEGFRGRGGYRGGGGDRGTGDFRGRGRGEWKPRGDYRGRGEGRGGYRGRPAGEATS